MNKYLEKYQPFLICFVAACFFSYELVQLHMLNALSPHIMKEMHLNATELSALSSSYLLADVLFLVPAGLIIDRFSLRKVLLFALGFCVLGTFGFAFSQNLVQASISHFFSGIGNAFCFLSCMILANGWFKERSTFVMSFMVTFGLLGGVIAQVPFSLLAEKLNWRNALVVDAFIGCGIWVLNYLFVKDARGEFKASFDLKPLLDGLKSACKIKETWICGLYTGCMNLPLMIISAMVGNLFLTKVHGFSQTKASLVISMISVGTIIGSSFFGFLSEKMKTKKKLMIFGALSSLCVFMVLLTTQGLSFEMITAIFFLIGFLSATQVLGYPLITDSAPSHVKGTAMGVAALIIMGIAFVLQPVTGILLDLTGVKDGAYAFKDFARAFSLFPLAFLASLVLSFFIKEKDKAVAVQ